jgi:hypothetical protein
MAKRKTPPPEALGAASRVNTRSPVTFRLTDQDRDRFLDLATRAGLGESTLARRIIEDYINEHAPRGRGK